MNSKTKPIQKSEFDGLKKWWSKRKPSDQALQVSIDTLKANGYSLDIKNPHAPEEAQSHTSAELLVMLAESLHSSDALL